MLLILHHFLVSCELRSAVIVHLFVVILSNFFLMSFNICLVSFFCHVVSFGLCCVICGDLAIISHLCDQFASLCINLV